MLNREHRRGRTSEREREQAGLQHIPHKTLTSCLWVLLSTQEEEEDEALTHIHLIMRVKKPEKVFSKQ